MQAFLLPVHAVPGSKHFAVEGFDEWTGSLKVRLQAKPEHGKANKQLLHNLSKILDAEIKIVAGERQREKRLLVLAPKEQVIERLSMLLADSART